jgi:sulfur carrier protein
MQINVNGKHETIEPCSIADYVHAKGMNPASLVIECNQKILKQEQWNTVQLEENDTLELLSFVGGG